MLKLAKKPTYNEIKKKWIEAVHSVGGGYVHSQTSAQDSGEQSLVTQVDLGWALWKRKKQLPFLKEQKIISQTCSGQGRKLVRRQLPLTDWLTEQQIALYFSWLSVLTRTGLLQRSPAVSMTEEEEADADELALEVTTDRTRQKIRMDLEL